MNRTALRIATVAALLQGGAGPFPTLAGDNVFDSGADPFDDMTPDERRPVIVVKTDEDRTPGNNTVVTGQRTIDLRIQFGILTLAKDKDGNDLVEWPTTDAALEAFIDLMEWQILAALNGNSLWAAWYRNTFVAANYGSVPVMTSPEYGLERLAQREIILQYQRFQADCLPAAVRKDDLPATLQSLPPLLVAVFDKIETDGGGDFKIAMGQIRAKLEAQDLPQITGYDELNTVTAHVEQGTSSGINAALLGSYPEE